jgi:hypothetical protein
MEFFMLTLSRLPLFAAIALHSGCASPDLGPEMTAFSEAVTSVSQQYRGELGIGPDAIQTGQIDALVADRGATLALSTGCDALGTGDLRASVSDCNLDFGDLKPGLGSPGRAAQQLELIDSYFTALQALATSTAPTDIQNATAAALDAVGALSSALPEPGLGAFAAELKSRRDPISKAAGFLAEQRRIAALRRVVRAADLPIARIVLDLKETAAALGSPVAATRYDQLNARQEEMDAAQTSSNDAAYRAAVVAFLAEYEAFLDYRRNGLIPRLDLIESTHGALRARISGGASLAEVRALIAKLNELKAGFN